MRTLLLLLLSIGSALAQPAFPPAFWASASGPPPVTYIFTEGFEEVKSGGGLGSSTDGFDATNIIANANSADPDYTGLVLAGSQSCASTGALTQIFRYTLTNNTTASYTELWAMVQYQATNNNGASLINFTTDANAVQGNVVVLSTGALRATNGSSNSSASVGTMTANNTYYVWYHWKSDGTADAAFSTTSTRPTGGNNFTSVSGGNGTTACTRLLTGSGVATVTLILDTLKVAKDGYPTP